MRYIDEFLKLRCASDVIKYVFPINNPSKEITEAMSIRKILRKITLAKPDYYTVIDLCAGNCLLSILVAFTLPVKEVIAIDKRKLTKDFSKIRKFHYIEANINDSSIESILINSKNNHGLIITAIHPCKELAVRTVNLYNNYADILILIPCCVGQMKNFDQSLSVIKDRYLIWGLFLKSLCKGNTKLLRDTKCISPKNLILVADKNGQR